jgi:hypothetical protein
MSRRPSMGHLFPGPKRIISVAWMLHFIVPKRKPLPAANEEHRA